MRKKRYLPSIQVYAKRRRCFVVQIHHWLNPATSGNPGDLSLPPLSTTQRSPFQNNIYYNTISAVVDCVLHGYMGLWLDNWQLQNQANK